MGYIQAYTGITNWKSSPVRNDWIHQIQNDLETCGIEESEDEISKMKKCTFKKLLDEKVQQISLSYLILKIRTFKIQQCNPALSQE